MFNYILILFILLSTVLCNNKLYVDEIIIKNNDSLSDEKLYANLKLKRPTLFLRSEFSSKLYNYDLQNLIGYYKTNGYLDVNISGSYEKKSNQYITITYLIEEGKQYQFNKLIIAGNKYLSKEKIYEYFKKGIGAHFNPAFIRNQILNIKKEYLRNGKLDIFIKEEIIIDKINITLRVNISEGMQYTINEININGLKSIDKKYIKREIMFKEGEIYNIDNIDLTRTKIFHSGIFGSVEILPNIIKQDSGFVDISIRIREHKASSIEADFGFSELSAWQDPLMTPGFDLSSRWVIGNIMQTPSKIIITARLATEINLQSLIIKDNLKQIDTRLTYISPWTLNFRFPSELRLFYKIDNKYRDDLERYGLSHLIFFEKKPTTRYELRSTYQIVNSQNAYYDEKTEPVRSVELKYTKNHIKNIISPKGGYYIKLSTTLFGTFLGGKRDFFQINNEFRKYFPLLSKGILAFRYKMGYIYNLNNTMSLPFYYKYELGGQSSLRGWLNTEHYDDSRGKLIYDLINLEFRFNIYKKWGGELFTDLGRLYNDILDFTKTNLSWNYGLGISYDTAFGPLRIDYAIPYIRSSIANKKDHNSYLNKSGQIHVSLLYMF